MRASRLSIGISTASILAALLGGGCVTDTSPEPDTSPAAAEGTTDPSVEAAAVAQLSGEHEYDFLGSSFPVGTETVKKKGKADVEATTTLHHFAMPDGAQATAFIIYETHKPKMKNGKKDAPEVDPECPETCGKSDKPCQFGVKLVSMTWVQTDDETSGFTGAVTNQYAGNVPEYEKYYEQSRICTNGSEFYIDAKGKIIDTKGPKYPSYDPRNDRDWTVKATTSMYLTEGTLTVDW